MGVAQVCTLVGKTDMYAGAIHQAPTTGAQQAFPHSMWDTERVRTRGQPGEPSTQLQALQKAAAVKRMEGLPSQGWAGFYLSNWSQRVR